MTGIPQLNAKEYHFDEGKPRTDLVQPRALLELAKVSAFGAKKYGDRNWEEYADKLTYSELIGSAIRHILKWLMREDYDEESGLHHLSHASWNLFAIVELTMVKRGVDNRSKLGGK